MANSKNIRLLIAESDPTLREALAIYFGLEDDIEVVGQAANKADARLLSQQLLPDVILVSSEREQAALISFIQALCQELPNSRIVVLSAHFDGTVKEEEILQVGASKYVEKGIYASELTCAIREVYNHAG
jgi:DNA-binding NarL/FixJ family response regulator